MAQVLLWCDYDYVDLVIKTYTRNVGSVGNVFSHNKINLGKGLVYQVFMNTYDIKPAYCVRMNGYSRNADKR